MARGTEVLNGPNGLKTTWEYVTPERARDWLANQAENRPPRLSAVKRLTDELQRGYFVPTHQGVAFDANGKMRDGQHRCRAIVASGVPTMLMVTRGLTTTGVTKTDCGVRRRDTDQLKIAGVGDLSNSTVAAIRVALCGFNSLVSGVNAPTISTEQFQDFASAFAVELDSVRGVEAIKTVGNRVVGGVLLRCAISTGQADRVREMVKVLASGMPEGPADAAAVVLKEAFLNKRISAGERTMAQDAYWKTQNAVMHFVKRVSITALRAASSELFPIHADRLPESCRCFVEVPNV